MDYDKKGNYSLFCISYLGFCILSTFNSLISSMNLFKNEFKLFEPEFYFPTYNYVLFLGVQAYIMIFGNFTSLKRQLIISLIGMTIILPMILISTIYVSNKEYGFYITSILIIIQGFFNSIYLSSCYGICGKLPVNYTITLSTFMTISGIVMNIIKYIVILIFGARTNQLAVQNQAIIYFSVVTITLAIGIVVVFRLFSNAFFLSYINTQKDEESINLINYESIEKNPSFFNFKYLIVTLWPTNLIVFLDFVLTFSVYPGMFFTMNLL